MSNIEFINVNKIYENGYHAVTDFNLCVQNNEFIVFVGPSGCGKSTTLRMLAGLEDISSGEIKINGKVINDVEPKDRNIAMVFQNYALYPHMTVYNNMAYALKNQKFSKEEIKEKISQAAKLLQLESYLDRKPSQLSGGQNQRVALGRAMVRNPEVFLMDEPLSNLDAKLRTQMRTEINKLHKELNTTFIYVTHDQTEAMTLGDRIVVMKDGIIQQVDSPVNLYENPINEFVAGFIGSPRINMLNMYIDEKEVKLENSLVNFPEELFTNIKSYTIKAFGKSNIKLAIRPEHINIKRNSEKDIEIKTKVVVVESLGSEKVIYTDFNGNEIIIRDFDNLSYDIDQEISVYLNSDKIFLFDPETGKRIDNKI
ncbi:sn-glycerol-3-phosphate ABC transporter ATP-binding protein UgpC [Anaerococcus sp. AGMB00486]|uniref:Sn-glycerol-3-phosphate ABC transporter ATP-binding protein UgpC n=2 Tax=Anaerococcus TaxID=165779 RepID=A0ABX2N8U3_9FIRM|nr:MULTISPECIES: sn-glycerol-3-phosphate ABC transporter ATP-binding protein UgpC [Anaerococcus]MDY3005892.1 sn-glycerol-3-phosphate ABC transporter ATP-binding protein UgpC [Anaerococcus porci]MSS77458.1 sn-glycerol-3-phosphate ABC transporter ATP-binding protein UgpC [Anaerococcus porci]NVF11126.1 sn-glycerol-3-phosphate ABC transporter ATP-binding protein UgpC [Anaerococcus faecalis]